MFAFSRVPRVFILAGIILILLVLGTNRYLYDDETYYPSSVVPQPGPKEGGLGHATRPDDATVVDETIGVASTDKADVSAKASAAPVMAPSLTSSAQPVATTAELLHAGGNKQDDSLSPILTLGPCSELEFLKRAHTKQGLTDELRYKKICFQPVFSDNVDRNVIANVSTQIFGDEMTIDVNNCEQARLSTCTPIKLEVPRPYADYSVSHLIFGIATDYTRLEESLESFAHWLSRPSGKGAKLLALVTDYHQREASEIQQLQQKFSSLGINADLVKPLRKSYTTSQNHFTVLAHMLDSSTPDTQWYGLLDDDTFCKSLEDLADYGTFETKRTNRSLLIKTCQFHVV